MQDVALLFHVLGALGFAAGIVLAGAAYKTARRREYPAEIALLLGLARIRVLLVGAGGLVIRRGARTGLWFCFGIDEPPRA